MARRAACASPTGREVVGVDRVRPRGRRAGRAVAAAGARDDRRRGDGPNRFAAQLLEVIYLGDHCKLRLRVAGSEEFIAKVPASSATGMEPRRHADRVVAGAGVHRVAGGVEELVFCAGAARNDLSRRLPGRRFRRRGSATAKDADRAPGRDLPGEPLVRRLLRDLSGAQNPPGQPAFRARPGTPSVNGLTPTLIERNPNSSKPFRIDRTQSYTCDQDHEYTAEQKARNGGLMDQFVRFDARAAVQRAPVLPQGARAAPGTR